MSVKFLQIGLLLVTAACIAQAQPKGYIISARNGESVVKEEDLRAEVEFLTDSLCAGRATGTGGSVWAQSWIAREFKAAGLLPAGGSYFHGFRALTGATGHNVIGFLPGSGKRYVVVTAHYDHIGTLSGTLYPGADNNASGVAALLSLTRMFQHMKELGRTYSSTLIFVALDAKELSLAGSHRFWDEIADGRLRDPSTGAPVLPADIDRMVNIDQVGGTEAPIHPGRPDYLMMLSGEKDGRRDVLHIANAGPGIGLDLDFTYYGSPDFTRVFYRVVSDQRPFLEHGIPAVMFTSGITFRNNKPDDHAASLDYAILRRRILAIYHYLVRVI